MSLSLPAISEPKDKFLYDYVCDDDLVFVDCTIFNSRFQILCRQCGELSELQTDIACGGCVVSHYVVCSCGCGCAILGEDG